MQTQEKWKNTIETETYMAQCLFQYIFSLLIIVLKNKKKKKKKKISLIFNMRINILTNY